MKIKFFLIAVLLSFFSNSIYATHVVGGDIRYTHIGGDSFKISLTLIRDCGGIQIAPSVKVELRSDCHNNTINLYPKAATGNDITLTCPYFQSTPCNPIPNEPILVPIGYELYEYETIYVFPANLTCKKFKFSYNLGVRPLFGCFYPYPYSSGIFFTEMDRSNFPDNSSPVFNNSILWGVDSSQFVFNFNAVDPDGDDLVYHLYAPHLDSAGSPAKYVPGFSYLGPIKAHYPIEFDETTGILKVNPDGTQATILAVRVEEYRDGILIGYVEKEIQIYIITSAYVSNPKPVINGVNNSNIDYIVARPGDNIDFTVSASDPNQFQQVSINWNEGIPGATFTVNGSTGNFKWTVDSSHVKFRPHIFTIQAIDDGCPIVAYTTKAFKIYVVNDDTADVWPGDADNNFNVSMYDLFPIGIAYGATGPARANASVNWVAQPASNWSQVFDNTMNYKYADANGDGTVDSADVAVVYQNYGLIHQKTLSPAISAEGALKIKLTSDTLWQGQQISAEILLGDEDVLIPNLYGIAFKLNFNSKYIEAGSVRFTPSNWMGSTSNNSLIYFEKEVNNGIEIALSKTDQKNISGYGKLGTLEFQIKDSLATGIPFDDLVFIFSGIKAITKNYIDIPVEAASTFVKIESTPTGIDKIIKASDIKIYPNPANDAITVETAGGKFDQLTFFDIQGKVIYQSHIEKGKAIIDVKDLPAGVYIVNLKGEAGSISKKVMVE